MVCKFYLSDILVVHDFQNKSLSKVVNGNVNNLVEFWVKIIVDDIGPRFDNAVEHNTNVWIRLAAKRGFNILDIFCPLNPKPDETDGRGVGSGALEAASHVQRLPFGADPDSTCIAATQGPPTILPASLLGRR